MLVGDVDADCRVAANKRIITIAQCADIANQMLSCSLNKIVNGVINNQMRVVDAQSKSKILRTESDNWFNACSAKVMAK